MSGTEALIWTRLRGGKLDGWRFRRQKPIGPYFVDFYCPAAWLVIEVDGPVHDRETRWAYDARRKAWLEAEGYRVLTIPVSDIGHDLSQVMDRIRANLAAPPAGCAGHLPIKVGRTCRRANLPAPPAAAPPPPHFVGRSYSTTLLRV